MCIHKSKGKRKERLNYYQFKRNYNTKIKEAEISVQVRIDSNQKPPCMRNPVYVKIVE